MSYHATAADKRLLLEVEVGDIRSVKEILRAGASVDGSRELPLTPLMLAVFHGHTVIAKLLIKKGADLEICVQDNVEGHFARQGMRAIHLAVVHGRLGAVRLLLQAGANPNCADDEKGCTPLVLVCLTRAPQRDLIVQELLEAGADPALPLKGGCVALHSLARLNEVGMLDTLLRHAPSTLNKADVHGITPLFNAAESGSEGALSYLLSAGANNREAFEVAKRTNPLDYRCPLSAAVGMGHENVIRILLGDGLGAVGGLSLIIPAMVCALRHRQPRSLKLLLNVQGKEKWEYWARCSFNDLPVLHYAAGSNEPTGVSILLSAGADETVPDRTGQLPRDTIGTRTLDGERDASDEAAVYRALERGPAFRAQSWTWPLRRRTKKSAAAVTPYSSRVPRARLDVRVFRPRERKSFVKLIGRYAQKP